MILIINAESPFQDKNSFIVAGLREQIGRVDLGDPEGRAAPPVLVLVQTQLQDVVLHGEGVASDVDELVEPFKRAQALGHGRVQAVPRRVDHAHQFLALQPLTDLLHAVLDLPRVYSDVGDLVQVRVALRVGTGALDHLDLDHLLRLLSHAEPDGADS